MLDSRLFGDYYLCKKKYSYNEWNGSFITYTLLLFEMYTNYSNTNKGFYGLYHTRASAWKAVQVVPHCRIH